MAILGMNDLKNLIFTPALWNTTEMQRVALQSGQTFQEALAAVNAGLQLLSQDMTSMPWYSKLLAIQDDVVVRYNVGAPGGNIEEATEYGVPAPYRHSPFTGHSLPIKKYDRSFGWTMMYLRDAMMTDIDADVAEFNLDARNHWQKSLLTRFFKSTAEPVAGTASQSVPFADGGTADATYVPPTSPTGKTFLSSHNHYLRVATPLTDALAKASVLTLSEHGHVGPYELWASEADAALWRGFASFRAPQWPGIVYNDTTNRAQLLGDITGYGGYFETEYGICRIWFCPRVPTGYFSLFKDYGGLSSRNPLRVRINRNYGWGWKLVPGLWANAPTSLAVALAEWGLGIGEDRTNGVFTFSAASGNYVDPTIS